jgi:hypothetical protein
MKIWKITAPEKFVTYDTYDSAIVAAETEEDARSTSPSGPPEWPTVDRVTVEYLGEAKPGTERGVILASFNAG